MVSATTLIFHVYILVSLFFQILSIMLTSKRTDPGFSLGRKTHARMLVNLNRDTGIF